MSGSLWFGAGLVALLAVAQGAARTACLRWAREEAWLARRLAEDVTEHGIDRMTQDMRRMVQDMRHRDDVRRAHEALPSDAPNPWTRRPGEHLHPSPARYADLPRARRPSAALSGGR